MSNRGVIAHVCAASTLVAGFGWNFRDAGEDCVHFRPIDARCALSDGGAMRRVIERRDERGSYESIHCRMLALGELARLGSEGFGEFYLKRHGETSMAEKARGSKTSILSV